MSFFTCAELLNVAERKQIQEEMGRNLTRLLWSGSPPLLADYVDEFLRIEGLRRDNWATEREDINADTRNA